MVNVTSLATVSPWPALGHYCSTKAALALATETLRLELMHTPVHVLEVIPGPVKTAILAESKLLPGFRAQMRLIPQGDPVVLARLVADALESGRARVVYPRQAGGSLIIRNGKAVGSELIGQYADDPKYFWGRLSATGPVPDNSAASSGCGTS